MALTQRHGPIHAAALALENAVHIDPSFQAAQDRLTQVAGDLGFHTEVVSDPRIAEAAEALKKQPQHPGLLKRLADLHRAAGNMRECAKYLKRYLRQKEDSAAVQQLLALLWGPGSDQGLVTGTIQRLRTQDIVAGIKTGGMSALKPEKSLKERASATMTAEQRAAVAAAAQRGGATGVQSNAQATGATSPRTGGFHTTSDEARFIAGMAGESSVLEDLKERFGALFWVGAAGAVVLIFVVGAAIMSKTLVTAAQKDIADHAAGEILHQEDHMFNFQQTKLNEAAAAMKKGNFVGCVVAATVALEGEKTAKMVLNAKWMQAQCSLMAGDVSTAREALQDFKDNANIKDKRFELAKTQLKAIERGETPGGIREL